MNVVLGVPVVRRYDLLGQFFQSLKGSELVPSRVLVVDNGCQLGQSGCQLPDGAEVISPGRNVGVSAAWNLMTDKLEENDVLIVANDDIRLKPYSLSRVSTAVTSADLVEGPSFVLCALSPRARRVVGPFDENFFPAYYEDNDYARRIKLAMLTETRVSTDIDHEGSASLRALTNKQQGEFGKQFHRMGDYYKAKWGGPPLKEAYAEPFNGKPPAGWSLRPITQGGKVEAEPWL